MSENKDTTSAMPNKYYSGMLYALADEIGSDEGIVTESAEAVREAAERIDTLTLTVRGLEIQREHLTTALVRIRDGATNQGAHTGMSWAQIAEIANAAIDGVKSTQATVKESLTPETSAPAIVFYPAGSIGKPIEQEGAQS